MCPSRPKKTPISLQLTVILTSITIIVENYSEIDWLDYDARTRNTIHRLLEPCLKAQVEDKAMIAKLQRIIEDHNRRVNDIETILFKKDEDERMGLFDSIYSKITENEKARLMEEEKMRDEIGFIRNEVSNNTFTTQNIARNFKNLEEQNLRTNTEL
jgi:hypothetical protein